MDNKNVILMNALAKSGKIELQRDKARLRVLQIGA